MTVKKLASRQDTSYNLKLDKGLCFSAEYDITVKTDVQGSTPSQTVHIEMPKIPAPDMLVNHPGKLFKITATDNKNKISN